jgi:hypothetical protein
MAVLTYFVRWLISLKRDFCSDVRVPAFQAAVVRVVTGTIFPTWRLPQMMRLWQGEPGTQEVAVYRWISLCRYEPTAPDLL